MDPRPMKNRAPFRSHRTRRRAEHGKCRPAFRQKRKRRWKKSFRRKELLPKLRRGKSFHPRRRRKTFLRQIRCCLQTKGNLIPKRVFLQPSPRRRLRSLLPETRVLPMKKAGKATRTKTTDTNYRPCARVAFSCRAVPGIERPHPPTLPPDS